MTTLLPMWILCGCRSTTFWPKTTLRPHDPSSHGYSAFRSARPSAPAPRLRERDDELVLQQRAEARPADDERRVLRAARRARREQLLLRSAIDRTRVVGARGRRTSLQSQPCVAVPVQRAR